MQIDRRVTNGLAWAGALLVVAVPSIDYLTGQFAGADAAPTVAVIEPANAAAPAPLGQRPDAPQVAATGVVDNFIQSGRPLPSYITGAPAATPAPAPVAVAPAPAATPATPAPARPLIVTDPVQVAAVPPKVAPIPMPLSMRPRPVIATESLIVNPPTGAPIINPVAVAPPSEPVYVPPSVGRAPAPVTAADLEDWESGPLSEFLARRQQQQQPGASAPAYESEGFYLDQWNNRQPRGRDRLVGPGNEFFVPFGN